MPIAGAATGRLRGGRPIVAGLDVRQIARLSGGPRRLAGGVVRSATEMKEAANWGGLVPGIRGE
jgi:hypothetical protein